MPPIPVPFFCPYAEGTAILADAELSDHIFWSREGEERRRAWLLQTYLHLQRAGHDVVLPEPEGLTEFHRQYERRHRSLFVLTLRADIFGFRSPLGDGDITRNGRFADERRTFFVPHWPQPGLLTRDPARGNRIEHIVFKGGYENLHADYRSEEWMSFLDRRDLQFSIASAETEGAVPNWHDYRTADLTLAVRPPSSDGGLRYEKPASKLVNAWHAGGPSLLGKEYAYRELRKSDLDYVAVDALDDTVTAIDRLLDDSDRYQRIIENGQNRAQEFTAARITERWAEILFDRVPKIASTRAFRFSRAFPIQTRRISNFVTMPPFSFELRKMIGHGMRHLRAMLHPVHR